MVAEAPELVEHLQQEIARLQQQVKLETKARINAEVALRSKLVNANAIGFIKPIGVIRTCFPQKFGTPRQGILAGASRGRIYIDDQVIGPGSLDGLQDYSHCWVLTIFHENTNMHKLASIAKKNVHQQLNADESQNKDSKAPPTSKPAEVVTNGVEATDHTSSRQRSNEPKPKTFRTFKSYICPPQAGGEKVGLFASRSPHRPNPIALSLCKIEKVDGSTVLLSGVDLVDNTPVLDIKPFVKHVDYPGMLSTDDNVYSPSWVTNPKFTRVPVTFTDTSRSTLMEIIKSGQMQWYAEHETEEAITAIEQILSLDPRGVIHGRGNYSHTAKDDANKEPSRPNLPNDRRTFRFRFDNVKLSFIAGTKREIIVNDIHLCHDDPN